MSTVVEISSETHFDQVLAALGPALAVVDFYATWCGPCVNVAPKLAALAGLYSTARVAFFKVDVDKHKGLAMRFGVKAMPTFVFIQGGAEVHRVKGGVIDEIIKQVEAFAPPEKRHVEAAPAPAPAAAAAKGAVDLSTMARALHLAEVPAVAEGFGPALDAAVGSRSDPVQYMLGGLRGSLTPHVRRLLVGRLVDRVLASPPIGTLLIPYALRDMVSPQVWGEVLDGIEDTEDKLAVVQNILGALCDLISRRSASEAAQFMTALSKLLQVPAVACLAMDTLRWGRSNKTFGNGHAFQQMTYIGAILGSSVFASGEREELGAMELFPYKGPARDRAAKEGIGSDGAREIHNAIGVTHDAAFPLMQGLLKNQVSRAGCFQWLSAALQANSGYTKTRFEGQNLASRIFMINVTNVLLSLFGPLSNAGIAPGSAPIHVDIPVEYVVDGKAVIPWPQDTERMAYYDIVDADANQATLERWRKEREAACPDVKSINHEGEYPYKPRADIFFLTAKAVHLGVYHAWLYSHNLEMSLDYTQRKESIPQLSAMFKYTQSILLENDFCKRLMGYYCTMARYLLGVMDTDKWKLVPQHFADDVVNGTDAILRRTHFAALEWRDVLTLVLRTMGNEAILPKPHTHGYFPSLLFTMWSRAERDVMGHPDSADRLVVSSINCYVTLEKCSYQDRAQARYSLSWCLKHFLQHDFLAKPVLRMLEDAKDPTFERFITMISADANHALDDAMESLKTMHEEEQEKTAEDLEANSKKYKKAGRMLDQATQLSTQNIQVLTSVAKRFTKAVAQNLVARQIANMLIKFLLMLAGSKMGTLKIKYPHKYGFVPRDILGSIVSLFLLFRDEKPFLRYVSENAVLGNQKEELVSAMQTIIRRPLVVQQDADLLEGMLAGIIEAEKAVLEEAANFDDAPDFALCALMMDPLTNPVALPDTGEEPVIVNYDTIRHHLLGEEKHPYTNDPLTMDEVDKYNAQPDIKAIVDARKTEIAQWLMEQKKATAEAAAAKAQASE